jgi:PD-(D/E)XK nuclease superfamily
MAKVNIVFDMSKYDLFLLCEQRFNLRHNLNIGLPGKPEQMDRGSLVHVANEVYYQALKEHKHYDDAANMALSKIREAGVISTDLDNETISRVVDVMEEYYDYWRIADQGVVFNEVEQPFMYLLFENDDVRIYLAGKIDLIVSDNRYTNEPWDHKSYDRTYNVGRMNNQFKNYCVATESNFLTVNKIGFQKTLKPHEKFIRTRLSFDPIILDEWKKNVTDVLMHKYLDCVARNIWPMNETSCEKFNRRCEFYEICDASGLPAKNYKINRDYIQLEPWDVTRVMRRSSETIEDLKKQREKAANAEADTHSQTEEA